jgi:hypothetical protein
MSEGTAGILKKRKIERHSCSLIGRCLTDRGIKFRKIFRVSGDNVHFIFSELKADITKTKII